MTSHLPRLFCLKYPHPSHRTPAIHPTHDEQADGQEKPPPPKTSPFLQKLPSELRLLIYYYVFQHQVFHLVRTPADKNPPSSVCPHHLPFSNMRMPRPLTVNDHPLFPRQLEGPPTPSSSVNITLVEYSRERPSRWALLLTCRQVHNESWQSFYSASTLRFDDPQLLVGLALRYLPPPHLKALRRLEIIWNCHVSYRAVRSNAYDVEPRSEQSQLTWDRMWRLVMEEMDISSLKVWFAFSGAPWVPSLEEAWVQPLLKIRGLSECGLYIEPCGVGLHDGCLAQGFRDSLRDLLRQNGNRMID